MIGQRQTQVITPTPTTRGMRLVLFIAAILVLIAGIQLFVLSDYTDRFFAWTINPPITAAFIGAGYWSSFTLEVLALRRAEWARARIAVPTAFAFTILALIFTLLHLDKFHLGSSDLNAQIAAWAWLVVYAGVPPVLLVLILQQQSVPGGDPPRMAPMNTPYLWAVGAIGAVMALVGLLLFVLPEMMAPAWPWSLTPLTGKAVGAWILTPLTGRAVGAWFLAMSVAAFHAVWERDLDRTIPGLISFLIFGLLQLVVVVRYAGQVRWSEIGATLYVALCLSIVAVGLVGVLSLRQSPRSQAEILQGEPG